MLHLACCYNGKQLLVSTLQPEPEFHATVYSTSCELASFCKLLQKPRLLKMMNCTYSTLHNIGVLYCTLRLYCTSTVLLDTVVVYTQKCRKN